MTERGGAGMRQCELAIIGGGPAGLAAAVAARESGIEEILILEREDRLGGILNQCIHSGFGLHTFQEELTGPEYAWRYERQVAALGIPFQTQTMVLDIQGGAEMVLTTLNRQRGVERISARAVILAMGCRERPRGALQIPGLRPAGVFTAGTAQRLVNLHGLLPGREVVILGSGDIGLIMARRMALEGAHVQVVAEKLPYPGGLRRNVVQCLEDFGIPLQVSHTVTDIRGKERVEGVTISQIDAAGAPVPGTQRDYDCDTLLLSCGLIPENELSAKLGVALNPVTSGPWVDESLETSVEGVFACGNVLHVHDLVDYVSQEAAMAGERAADYLKGNLTGRKDSGVSIEAGEGIRYTVPSRLEISRMRQRMLVRFRVSRPMGRCRIVASFDGEPVSSKRRLAVTPGEMEDLWIDQGQVKARQGLRRIAISVQEE